MEEEKPIGYGGDNLRIRLRGVEDEDISPGFVLTSRRKPVRAVRQFEAQLAILDHKNIICAGYGAVMHIHTLSEEVTLGVRFQRLIFGRYLADDVGRRCCTTLTKRRGENRRSRLNLPRKVRDPYALATRTYAEAALVQGKKSSR